MVLKRRITLKIKNFNIYLHIYYLNMHIIYKNTYVKIIRTILEYRPLEYYKIIYIIRMVKISRFILCKQNSAETNI